MDDNRIETRDLILKKARFEDWESMYHNVWKHEESAKYMLWSVTSSEEEAKELMRRILAFQQNNPHAYFIYEKGSGQGIGFVGMKEISAGVFEDAGLALGPSFVRRGYGKQALNALLEEAKRCGAKEFIGSCRTENLASARLQQSCGFTFDHSEDRTDPRNGEACQLDFYRKSLEES